MSKLLEQALSKREREYTEAINRLRDLDDADWMDVELMREQVALIGCLRRLVGTRSVSEIHAAFGAPGDFGYETPIGSALHRLYRGGS